MSSYCLMAADSSVCSWIGVTCSLRHSRVTAVNISYMGLSGTIPPQLGNLSFLVSLDFSFNFFGGVLPQQLSFLRRLKFISFRANTLSGEIPPWLGLLTKLEYFSLRNISFTGSIPTSLSKLTNLRLLSFAYNRLSGQIPSAIFNISTLESIFFSGNELSGSLPSGLPREISKIYQLGTLSLGFNNFTGFIPSNLFNMSNLQVLSLLTNSLSGSLPTNLDRGLPALEELYLFRNNLTGVIPDSITNCSKLIVLDIGRNNFTGFLPHFLGNLRMLERLSIFGNNLRTESTSLELSFITSLTNCRSLNVLSIADNPLNGIIPDSVGNLSTSLQYLFTYNCKIKGIIPAQIGNLTNLVKLSLYNNQLSGNIPPTLNHLQKLQGLDLQSNNLTASIPNGICDLNNLVILSLSQNKFSSRIPECLGNITSLRNLYLESNMLSSSIPLSMWRLKNMLELNLSSNSLTGFIPPEIGNLVSATSIDLSMNNLSDSIPSTIGNLKSLSYLSMAHNLLEDSIPETVGNIINLVSIDLSYNNLSGSIPKSLEVLQHLDYFNVSFNALRGEIPTGGSFENFTAESFKGNEALCGIPRFHVPLCNHNVSKHKSRMRRAHLALFILIGVVAFISLLSLVFIFVRYRRKNNTVEGIDELVPTVPERISYYELLQATEQFSETNLLGMGSFGSVYKAVLRDGNIFAVKVFNSLSKASSKSFEVECEVLRNIRHRNLTKVMSSCSNEDFKALPSNVLLDEEMVAHLSDFGIAKLMGEGESIVHTNTLATIGYIAPEYGLEGLVSTRCDVYSYGVMVMETFTRKRPSDDMFGEDLTLKSWVHSSLNNNESSSEVIDANVLNTENEQDFEKNVQCVSSVLELALRCCAESSGDRINMKEALAELQKK
ncbi:hypothetical protein MIMGU_mgv1a021297mg, partial [Erythranthe guttata]